MPLESCSLQLVPKLVDQVLWGLGGISTALCTMRRFRRDKPAIILDQALSQDHKHHWCITWHGTDAQVWMYAKDMRRQ